MDSNMRLKIIALVVLFILVLVLAVYLGTRENKVETSADEKFNNVSVPDNRTKSSSSGEYGESDTYKVDISGVITKSVLFTTINVKIDASEQVDNKNRVMWTDMTVSQPFGGTENSGLYFVEDTLYTKNSGGWVKKELNETEKEDTWNKYNFIKREIKFINASDSELLGNETLNGVNTRVIEVTPGKEALKNYITSWLEHLSAAGLEKYFSSLDMSDMEFKNATFKYWIAEDTKLIKKEYIKSDVIIAGESYGMEISADVYDYGKQVNVILPEDALMI